MNSKEEQLHVWLSESDYYRILNAMEYQIDFRPGVETEEALGFAETLQKLEDRCAEQGTFLNPEVDN